MSKRPEMPFKYQGVDVEALGHLVSARVSEKLDNRFKEIVEQEVRRTVWDAILEILGDEISSSEPIKKTNDVTKTLSDFIRENFRNDERYGSHAKSVWDMFKGHCDLNDVDLNPSSYGKFVGQMKKMGYQIKNHDGTSVFVGLVTAEHKE